ncbi:MAG: polyisoprenoid-binding protein [Cytophagales bacterium CG12_big_fil_rev_8_21_14_0_65_40_12]|nr:MAG: polyisoprenoid-binding protein [Cytophagales bacterium CG12_big_fil_rev_8_21_14_0_65_40_12]PIW04565.1 MAG: polyisoprenoid-binding protein [Cytophagales bacterium CG17_big_fil_post_rev_8_21_14_2_50_40_13]
MGLKISLILSFLLSYGLLQGQELSVSFTIRNAGFNVEGKFTEASIDYNFDVKNLNSAYFNADIKVGSIDTGIGSRDKHLLKDKYFDVDQFPSMTFRSTQVVKEANQYFILGKLTIKGASRDLKIPLTAFEDSFEVEFELNRRDYGVGGNSLILSDDVNIKLKLAK